MNIEILSRTKTYSIIHRFVHWTLAFSFLILLLTAIVLKNLEYSAIKNFFRDIHLFCGQIFAISIYWRLLLFIFQKNSIKEYQHNAVALIAYRIFYINALLLLMTGFFIGGIQYGKGIFAGFLFDDFSWFSEALLIHNISFYIGVLFIAAHFVGMLKYEKINKVPIVQAMFSGYKYVINKEGE